MGLPEPRIFAVPANTLVVADTFGFHARGPASGIRCASRSGPMGGAARSSHGRRSIRGPHRPGARSLLAGSWATCSNGPASNSIAGGRGSVYRPSTRPERFRRHCTYGVGSRPVPQIRRAAAAPGARLLQRIDRENPSIVVYDLGAGAGNVRGADRRPLARGQHRRRRLLGRDAGQGGRREPPNRLAQADHGTWRPSRPAEIIYSNAALHWLDGHDAFFPGLLAGLASNGVLAVQIPAKFGARSHTLITEDGVGRAVAAGARTAVAPVAGRRAGLLLRSNGAFGGVARHVGNEYLQVLEGQSGQGMDQGYLAQPAPRGARRTDRSRFEAAYGERVAAAYPPRPDGKTLFPFRRLFLIATAA